MRFQRKALHSRRLGPEVEAGRCSLALAAAEAAEEAVEGRHRHHSAAAVAAGQRHFVASAAVAAAGHHHHHRHHSKVEVAVEHRQFAVAVAAVGHHYHSAVEVVEVGLLWRGHPWLSGLPRWTAEEEAP